MVRCRCRKVSWWKYHIFWNYLKWSLFLVGQNVYIHQLPFKQKIDIWSSTSGLNPSTPNSALLFSTEPQTAVLPPHLPEAVGGVVGVDVRPQLVHQGQQVVDLVQVKALAGTVEGVISLVVVGPGSRDRAESCLCLLIVIYKKKKCAIERMVVRDWLSNVWLVLWTFCLGFMFHQRTLRYFRKFNDFFFSKSSQEDSLTRGWQGPAVYFFVFEFVFIFDCRRV